jgi:hypothetical protein
MATLATGILAGLPAFGEAKPPPPPALTAEEKAQLEAIRRERLKEHDEAVQRALEEYRKTNQSARIVNDRVAAVKILGDSEKDLKIVQELARRLNDVDPIRREALAALAAYTGDANAALALGQALAVYAGDPGLLVKTIEALGDVGHPQAVPFLTKYLNYKENEPVVLAAAVRASGKCHYAAAIEPLVTLWEDLDKGLNSLARGKAEERQRAIGDTAIPEALANLTGQKFVSSKEYRKWWTQNRATHRPPPPPPPVLCKRHLGLIHLPGKPLSTGTIVHELWTGITGLQVENLIKSGRLNSPPDRKTELTSLESPKNIGDNFGARIRGYLHPPEDGPYTFTISGDDGFALYLSPDEAQEKKEQIAQGLLKTVESKPVVLKAGRRYYIEVLHKEDKGLDFVQVSWKTPRGASEVIPGRCLEPFTESGDVARVPPAAPPAAGGLIAHWPLGERTGTTASDASGNGRNGVLVNAPVWTPGGGLAFNGLNDAVEVSNGPSLGGSFTLALWVKATSRRQNCQVMISKGPKDAAHYEIYLDKGSGEFCFFAPKLGDIRSQVAVDNDQWKHLAVTYDGARLVFYVNGVGVKTAAVTGDVAAGDAPLVLGRQTNQAKGGMPFEGLLKDVRIYNRALSAADVEVLYRSAGASASPTAPPPLAPPRSVFYRAVNFNGPAVTLDGQRWESSAEANHCLVAGSPYENETAPLDPPVEGDRAKLLRTAFAHRGSTTVILGRVPAGTYHVFLYAWSNANSARFGISLKGRPVAPALTTGAAGRWERLGPWTVDVPDGTLNLECTGEEVNLCGIEVWKRE